MIPRVKKKTSLYFIYISIQNPTNKMFYHYSIFFMVIFQLFVLSHSSDFMNCIDDISYVGKDIVNIYTSIEDREYTHAIHYTSDMIHEFGEAVKPCHIETIDNTLEEILQKINIKEPEWIEEVIQLWIDTSDNSSIFDFLQKIEPICKNNTLKEIVDFLLENRYCITDIDEDLFTIIDLVKAYEDKNLIEFIKKTKTLVSQLSQTYVKCNTPVVIL